MMQAKRGNQLNCAYLVCFICGKDTQQPRLCPRCVNPFCDACLISSLTTIRQKCCACGQRVSEQDFLHPQMVLNLVSQVAQRVKKQYRRGEEREQCPQHQLILGYYCVECSVPICADCGLLTAKHVGHKFVSYRDIYEKIKRKVYDEFPRFDRKIKQLDERKGQLRGRLQNLSEEYKRYKKYYEEAYINYTEKVEAMGKVSEEVITLKGQANFRRLSELEHLRDSIYEQMEKKTQINLIKQTASLSESISALACQDPPVIEFQQMEATDELLDLIPEYETWIYELDSFSSKAGIVYSQGHIINGIEWRLKIYPKGNGLARDKYLSVFVEMTKALIGQNKYEYRIELINPVDPFLTVKREYCSTFQVGECWGYNQFQPLEQLQLKQFIDNDTLTFQVGIRNRSYRSLVNDQQLFIASLKNKLAERQRQDESKLKKIRGRVDLRMERRVSGGKELKCVQKVQGWKGQTSNTLQQTQQIPFERSQTYEMIQQYLKEVSKKERPSVE